ncbi:MAG: tRNA (adenosine(37)-N6)-threonylcarbamoyltransferase complex dimerization subunit type 1 TsaB [Phycisphaerales bacterium]|nr:tRNA (adenosine(37)-N6)-threonylcarbamoyltransferase complex dimerization subunit type 1 TsaB [Phycisphaerales bacterium]
MSVTLAIECSQRGGGVALRDTAGEIHTASLESASGVDDRLMSEVDRLFADAGLAPDALSLIGVSIGPGGFTGLRIAVTTAKMLAISTGCDVVAVQTALVVAGSRAGPAARIGVLLASRRGTAWLSCVDSGLQITGTPGLVNAVSIGPALAGCEVCIADAHLPPELLGAVQDAGVPMEPPRFDPVICLNLAEQCQARGEIVDTHHLEPLYPRIPEAVRLFEAR